MKFLSETQKQTSLSEADKNLTLYPREFLVF